MTLGLSDITDAREIGCAAGVAVCVCVESMLLAFFCKGDGK